MPYSQPTTPEMQESGYSSPLLYDPQSIAVVGLSCRFPGDASTPDKLWEMLCSGRSAISKVPKERWNVDAFYDPVKGRQNTSITEKAHFLADDVSAFDANFFTMSQAEVTGMDPQQRFMLEVSYEAFENAGIPMEKLAGTQTGCYVGAFTNDWREMQLRDPDSAPLYSLTGGGIELLANRLSWFYDLRGPSMVLETACSASLVSLHVACQSLRAGESKMALVGGANIFLNPDLFSAMSNQQFLSPDGLCKAFDESANGYGRGEGFAAVILKPIDDAIRDGDTIRAVIRGTGSNQDGKTKGITMPNGHAQESLIRSVYRKAGLSFKDTNYFEAHGTGTSAGDFAELGAIARTIGSEREEGKSIYVGSVKTNIGHLEPVAGLAGLIKSIYILENALIPANLWFKNPNSRIPFDKWRIAVPTSLTPWPYEGLRRISVNSFGYGGANAHVVLDDAYHYLTERRLKAKHRTVMPSSTLPTLEMKMPKKHNSKMLFVFSTQDQDGLLRQRQALAKYLSTRKSGSGPDSLLSELAFTLSEKRSRLQWKSYCIASSVNELTQSLEKNDYPAVRSTVEPRLGFVFTGQGAQWAGMGVELMCYQVFRESVEAADAYLKNLGCPWTVIAEMDADDSTSNINLPYYSQTLCAVLQVAMVELLESWKITPKSVVGHSSGEIGAAYCLGALTRENAWKVGYFRGLLSSRVKTTQPSKKGAMMAVGASVMATQAWISKVSKGNVIVGCVNSPSSITVSGDEAGIDELQAMLKKENVFARKLKVEAAYHSPHMEIVALPLFEALKDISTEEALPGRQMFTSVSGELIDASELGASHWIRNMLSPVLFSDAVAELVRPKDTEDQATGAAVDMLIEIGPHSALQGPLSQILKKVGIKGIEYRSLLSRGRNGVDTTLAAIGDMFTLGVSLDMSRVNLSMDAALRDSPTLLVDLPPYTWNHSRNYWSGSRLAKKHSQRQYQCLSLVGAPYPGFSDSEQQWRGFLRIADEPWIQHHRIQTSILYPAAGFLTMVIEAATQIADSRRITREFKLREIQISSAVLLDEKADLECILQLRPHPLGTRDSSSTWLEFTVSTCATDEDPKRNCSGLLSIEYEPGKDFLTSMQRSLDLQDSKSSYLEIAVNCAHPEDPTAFYQELESVGLGYGPPFRGVTKIRNNTYGQSICAVEILDTGSAPVSRSQDRPHIIHPTVLDSIIHTAFAALKGNEGELSETLVPKFIEEVIVAADIPFQTGTQFRGYATSEKYGLREVMSDIYMFDEALNKPMVVIKGLNFMEISFSGGADEEAGINKKKICSKLVWKPAMELISHQQQKELIETAISTRTIINPTDSAEKDEMHAFATVCRVLGKVSPGETPSVSLHGFYKWLQDQLNVKSQLWQWTKEARLNSTARHAENAGSLMSGGRLEAILEQVLLGKANAEQLLEGRNLEQFYSTLRGVQESRTKLTEYVNLLAHTKPGMFVLELGSAISGAASSVLAVPQGVPETVEFTYASTTASTLESAKEQLQPFKATSQFKVLEIDQNPTDQGFEEQSFDMIVGCNVFANTQNLDKAVANVKKLLKPGGKLCFVELTNPGIQALTVLGRLCDWWEKRDDQTSRPLTVQALQNCFTSNSLHLDFTSWDFEDPRLHQTSLIVATAVTPAEKSAEADEIIILQLADAPQASKSLATQVIYLLEQSNVSSRVVPWSRDLDLKDKKAICLTELEAPMLADLKEADFIIMQQAITQVSSLLWVTALEEPAGAPVIGLARSVRNERAGIEFRTLQLNHESLGSINNVAELVANLAISSTTDLEFREEAGILKTCRLEEDIDMNIAIDNFLSEGKVDLMPLEQAAGPQKLCIRNPGMLDSLCFEADELHTTALLHDEVEIEVKASALNFRDVMSCMGQVPDKLLGFEASGIISRVGSHVTKFRPGDQVCTLGHGAHRAVFRNKAILCQGIPAGLSFEEAACLSLVHCTAYHALINIARATRGQSVLIHAAAGGVGQAAIMLAQHLGMEIFATVGSPEKKLLIQDAYSIADDHIFNSRDLSFAKGIMRVTNGHGVDCVLNSLAGEALRQSWHCLADFGTFVEIGMKDILGNTGLDMRPFKKDTMFAALNLEHVQKERPHVMAKILGGTFDLLRGGAIKPVTPLTIYPISNMESAFRIMQTGKHSGKIVLSYSPQDVVPILHRPSDVLKLNGEVTYVLVGGLGGLGRSLSNLLVEHGARHLAFVSRSGAASTSAKELVHDLESRSVRVKVYTCDIADSKALKRTVDSCSSEMPRISGIVQCAMVLRDILFENMTHAQWTESLRPKVQGSWNLHSLMPKDLDFFVCLSSFSGIFGNRGQSNYAAAGTYEDGLAHYRRSKGLKAVTVDLGIMRDVGVLAEQGAMGDLKDWEGPFGIRELEFHALMKKAIYGQLTYDGSGAPAQIVTGIPTGGMVTQAGIKRPYYFDDAKFEIMARMGRQQDGGSTTDEAMSLKDQLAAVESTANAAKVIIDALIAKIAKSLQLPTAEIDPRKPLHSYGVDSLVAVEIRNWIMKEMKSDITVFDIMATVPMAKFAETVIAKRGNGTYVLPENGPTFRNCTQSDVARVLAIVEAEIAREHRIGWFDQYLKLIGDVDVKDIVVAVEGGSIGIALTYTPSCCSPVSFDLPWAGQIGEDVGGVTCICIPPATQYIIVPILDACIQKPRKQGMKQLFLDAVMENVDSFGQLGFKEWAVYRNVWRDV